MGGGRERWHTQTTTPVDCAAVHAAVPRWGRGKAPRDAPAHRHAVHVRVRTAAAAAADAADAEVSHAQLRFGLLLRREGARGTRADTHMHVGAG
jgi:hypothetical protein